jgi:drug/metabolite transporter (DMT)-like permease
VIAGVLLALLTSVSWVFGNVFIQKSGRAIGTVSATLWALVVGALLAGGLSSILGEARAAIDAPILAWTAAAALSGLLGYGCLFYSFEHAPLSLAVPVVSSWSLVASVLSLTVLGERLRPLPLAGAALVFAGVLLVSTGAAGHREPGPLRGTRPRGAMAAAFGAAVGFGVMIPALTRVASAWGALGATALVYALVAALGLPLALACRLEVKAPPRAALGLVLATGLAETVGFVSISVARRFAPLTVVSPVASLAATLTVLYAWVVLGERPPRRAAIGAALACAGIVILSL